MLHHYLSNDNSGDHWGVGSSAFFLPGREPKVLAQIQNGGEQVRVALSADQAEEMAAALLEHAALVRKAKPIRLDLSAAEIAQLTPTARAFYFEALAAQKSDKS